jgi:hypothetical protein
MANATDGTTSRLPWRGALVHGAGAAFVAVFCYSTARLVPSLPEPYWAPIAAVVVLYPDHEATRKAAGQRFLGTALGSLVGWASAAWWHGNIVLYGLSVLVARRWWTSESRVLRDRARHRVALQPQLDQVDQVADRRRVVQRVEGKLTVPTVEPSSRRTTSTRSSGVRPRSSNRSVSLTDASSMWSREATS